MANSSNGSLGWLDSGGAYHKVTAAAPAMYSGLLLDAAGKVYYSTGSSSTPVPETVYCYASNGVLLWHQPLDKVSYLPGLALRDDGTLFVTTSDSLLAFADQ